MKKLFKIDESIVHKNDIEVFLIKGEAERNFLIPRAKFEKWLEYSDRLQRCDDSVNACGEHEQTLVNVPIDQYYLDFSNERIEADLYDYIILNYVDVFNVQPALNNILSHAFLHI